jgi:hypothetical protein
VWCADEDTGLRSRAGSRRIDTPRVSPIEPPNREYLLSPCRFGAYPCWRWPGALLARAITVPR